jgi:hypothetical protein
VFFVAFCCQAVLCSNSTSIFDQNGVSNSTEAEGRNETTTDPTTRPGGERKKGGKKEKNETTTNSQSKKKEKANKGQFLNWKTWQKIFGIGTIIAFLILIVVVTILWFKLRNQPQISQNVTIIATQESQYSFNESHL